jgi:hypothetical protein
LHPSYHSALVSGLMVRGKKQLETACGREVISVRQHYLHYDVRVTPRLQADADLKVDSSLGFNRSIGFRAGTSFPFCIWDHENDCPLPILEVPQIIMDCSLFETGSLEYNEGLALDHSLEIMDRVAEVGGCLTLNWHHDYIHDDRLWRLYGLLLEEAARRRAWGCSLRLLHDWWTAREKSLSVPLQ